MYSTSVKAKEYSRHIDQKQQKSNINIVFPKQDNQLSVEVIIKKETPNKQTNKTTNKQL
jgi:hypothetical protein